MMVFTRILAGLTFLLGMVGLLLSLAAGVGVWIVKGPATTKATRIFERIEAALDIADQGLDHVKTSLSTATTRLENARAEQRELARQPDSNNALRRMLARTVQQTIAPQFNNQVHNKLHTIAEAAVVVNSMLEDMGNFPFLTVTGLEVGDLTHINNRLTEVESSAWELSRLLGEPEPNYNDAGNRLSQVETALKAMRGLIAEYEPQVTQVRERTEALKARTLPWITPAAVLVSVGCLWIALSQVSLLCHACSWWKQSGHKP